MADNTSLSIDPYTIAWDGSHNWTVNKTVKATSGKAKGEPTEKFIGYYGTLYAACFTILRDGLTGKGKTDMATLLNAVNEASQKVMVALEDYRPLLEEVPAEALV